MRLRARAMRAWWMNDWRFRQAWHRYRVDGIERVLAPGAALIVGYHGRPSAHDLCMLQILLLERYGMVTHAIMHQGVLDVPVLRHLVEGFEFFTGDGPELAAAVAKGHKIVVTPGGTREGFRPSSVQARVDWGERYGFVKLAMRHKLPIIPVAGVGVDRTFWSPVNGEDLGKRLRLPPSLPAYVGLGPFGPWPLSLPFPVQITSRIGAPITAHLGLDPKDKAGVQAVGQAVRDAVQGLLDRPEGAI